MTDLNHLIFNIDDDGIRCGLHPDFEKRFLTKKDDGSYESIFESPITYSMTYLKVFDELIRSCNHKDYEIIDGLIKAIKLRSFISSGLPLNMHCFERYLEIHVKNSTQPETSDDKIKVLDVIIKHNPNLYGINTTAEMQKLINYTQYWPKLHKQLCIKLFNWQLE